MRGRPCRAGLRTGMEEDAVGKQGFELDVVEDVVVAASRDAAHAATEQLVGVDDDVAVTDAANNDAAVPVRSLEPDAQEDSDGALVFPTWLPCSSPPHAQWCQCVPSASRP